MKLFGMPATRRNGTVKGIGLSLAGLVLVAIVPLLIFGGGVAWTIVEQKKSSVAEHLASTASALRVAVDHELIGQFAAMEILSADASIDGGNFEAFGERARRTLKAHAAWLNLALLDPRSHAVVASALPTLGPAPLNLAAAAADEAAATRKPVIAGIFASGQATKQPQVLLLTPVVRDDQTRYLLAVAMDPKSLSDVFAEQDLPASWTGAVLDRNMMLAGRSRERERYVGMRTTASLAERIGAAERGMFSSQTFDGATVYTVFNRSPLTGWSVAIGIPSAEVERPLHETLFQLGAAGGVLMLSALIVALLVGRGIVRRQNSAEAALQESRERFDLAVRGSSDGIWDWNVETGSIYVSDRWCEMLGYPPGAVAFGPEGWTSWIHADDRAVAVANMREHFKTHQPYAAEYRLAHRNGDYRWVLNRGQAVWNAAGRAVRVAGSTSDITERKYAEAALRASEEKFAKAFRASPILISISTVSEGRYIEVNDEFLRVTGHTREQVVGHTTNEIRFWKNSDDRQRAIALLQKHGRLLNFQASVCNASGRDMICELSGEPILIDGRECIIIVTTDVTERMLAEEALRIAATAFESQEGMTITSAQGQILRVNKAFTEITGYSEAEVVGQNPRILKSGRQDAAFYAAMWECIQRTGAWRGEIWNRRKSGDVYPEWLSITAVNDAAGVTTHYVGTFTDVTSHKKAEEEITNLAFFDPLTGLPNRRLLLDRLKHAVATSSRSGRHGALLFLDLDNFKTLNDTRGHDIGDLLLQQVAQRLSTCVREGDTVARLGGDEFVVMLEDLSENLLEAANQTEAVGEKVLATLNQSYQLGANGHHSTPSVGVTLFANHQGPLDDLLKRADLAMYQAKAAGRNTLRFFDPEMQAVVATRAALEADLRDAVPKNQFVLYYQAQVDGKGRLTGMEALLRWQHPQRGLVSPLEFISLAEDIGLILPLGQWVLETACAQLALWANQPDKAHLTVAVNVSARQLHHPNFVGQVLAVLDKTGADPRRLKLELTESILVNDVEGVIGKMTALKAKGVCFSLDDFGTGYSSLSYLKRLPLDQLKIDQSFIKDILSDSNDAAIAKMVVALAESMGLTVIAEGVEIEAQKDFLAHNGCNAYQGYLFGRPLPIGEMEALAGLG